MSKKIKVEDLPTFDPAEHLKDDADIAAYLSLVIDEGDAGELAHALGIAARARGMANIAEQTGIGREALYKALRADSQPRFDTISRVCKALGVKLVVQPTRGSFTFLGNRGSIKSAKIFYPSRHTLL
jgi:probable addiction module antidote protein